ncbi:hypothetical protein [Proteiniphilum sp. X52]|uniref:hypothetical protein n=1 Tax=Proteiniphilum sp. X52 TaxID=2382159 RepID=UPI00210176E6|nr:hypothetical protein [Proteiniphilum sp. X52]
MLLLHQQQIRLRLSSTNFDHKDKALDPYRVKFDGKIRIEVEFTGKYQPLDLNKLNWKEVEKLGVSGENL